MADAHADHPTELNFELEDGSVLRLHRDEADRLVVTGFVAKGPKHAELPVVPLAELTGFGAWPSWDANRRQGLLTFPDEESGLFEPERLFVLREQYAFLRPPVAVNAPDDPAKYLSLGPINRGWWTGTEHIVQARQRSGKH